MSLTPTPVPVTSTSSASGSIIFSIGLSLNDPNAIVFGEENTPTSVSKLEIPGVLNDLGGKQAHAVHEFPGGIRTVQALGAFPVPISWRGIFLGGNAFARHYQMDAMRRNGVAAYLTYGPWRWKGLIAQFLTEAKYQNYLIYRAAFEPSVDLTASGQSAAPSPSQAANTMSQLIAQIQQQYQLDSALSAASQLALENYSSVATPLILAFGQGVTQLSSANLLSLNQSTSAATAALAVDAATEIPETMSSASSAEDAVMAITGTLTSVQTQTTITAVNPNLVQIASQYLGDATRWSDIANLNGLMDIEPGGTRTLSIPSV